jgi:hypothetical protein
MKKPMFKKAMSIVGLIIGLVVLVLLISVVYHGLKKAVVVSHVQLKKFDTMVGSPTEMKDGIICGPNAPEDVKEQFRKLVLSLDTKRNVERCLILIPFEDKGIFKEGGYEIGIKDLDGARLITLMEKSNRIVCQAYQAGKNACIQSSTYDPNLVTCLSDKGVPFSSCEQTTSGKTTSLLHIQNWPKIRVYETQEDREKDKKKEFDWYSQDVKTEYISDNSIFPQVQGDKVKAYVALKIGTESCLVGKGGKIEDAIKALLDAQGENVVCKTCAYAICQEFKQEECEQNECNMECFPSMLGTTYNTCISCLDVKTCTDYTTEKQCMQKACDPQRCALAGENGAFKTCAPCDSITACNQYSLEGSCRGNSCNVIGGCEAKYVAAAGKEGYATCAPCSEIKDCSGLTQNNCVGNKCGYACYGDTSNDAFTCKTCPKCADLKDEDSCKTPPQSCLLTCTWSGTACS